MIDLQKIAADLVHAIEEHGVDIFLLTTSEVQRNVLGEEVGASIAEVQQRAIKRLQRASIGTDVVEVPEDRIELIALPDTLIRKGAQLKISSDVYHVTEQRQSDVFGRVTCYIFIAERADGNGSG